MSLSISPIRRVALAVAMAASVMSVPAYAFSDDEARRAILELREQIKRINEQNQQARLQLADQLEMLRQEVATLRGQVEKANWQLRMQDGNGAQPDSSTSGVADPQERAAFETPMNLFREGKYKEASSSFDDFLQAYPNSSMAPDARFYQGSARYASKDFKGSIDVLQQMLQTSPKHTRAPDALLVIAASQTEQNNLKGAKASLERIIKDYPDSKAADTARSRLKLM
jgi:tol-pal system protein YbgF